MTLMTYENERNSHIHKLIELCLSTNYLNIFDNCVCILENSGLISLAVIVISEASLQHLEDRAMQEALGTDLAPLMY